MSNWPMLKHYDRDHLTRIAMPIGGIGHGHRFTGRTRRFARLGGDEPPGQGVCSNG